MTSLQTSQHHRIFKGHRTSRRLFIGFGTLFCLLALALFGVPYPDWSSRVAGFLLLTLPVGSFGWYFLHAGCLLRQARVAVSATGVALHIPNWQGGWLFRSRPVQLSWDEIYGVQHERLPVMAGGKAIDHYWIHSTHGTFLLTPNLCREAAEVAQLIATRTGYELIEPAPPIISLTPEQEATNLKRNAVAVVVILFALLFGLVLAVTAESAVAQMVQRGLWWMSQFFNLFFIVMTVVSVFGLWWKARRERVRRTPTRLAEKI